MAQDSQSICAKITMIAACSIAIAALVPVALFQCGVVEHLADPPGWFFDSESITASQDAHPFGIPDSLLGLASYGTTLVLAIRAPRSCVIRSALGAKLLLDAGMATVNTGKQFFRFKRACSWCMITAGATAVMVVAGRRYLDRQYRDCSFQFPPFPKVDEAFGNGAPGNSMTDTSI